MSTEDNRQQTFDDSLLPEWAIHKQDEEVLSTFFGAPADRGAAESAFAIPRGETDQRVVPSSAPVVESEPEPTPELTTEPETQSEPELAGEPAPESEIQPDSEPTPEPEIQSEPDPAGEPEIELDEEPAALEVDFEAVEDAGEEQPSLAPRRADFAKFRCIYESHDGQLALYEDEYGHLTAVNTNRFV